MKRLLALAFLCVFASPGFAQTNEISKQGIFINSEGIVRLRPEIAIIRAGVVTEGRTADEALSKNRPAINRAVEIVRKYGIASVDVTTSQLRINPKYTQPALNPGAPRAAPAIDGYEARTELEIIVRDLTKPGPLVDDLVKSGSNSISSLTFALTEPGKAKNEARRMAAQAAKERASLYAEALGLQLGELISITETEYSMADDNVMFDLPSRKAAPGTVTPLMVEPGEIAVKASVQTVWQIKK
ncbi:MULTISPECIES: SIMPL domain-containing protein [unclassified Bosea (in: a-proteobacteria)]|uniref:SIMPL domain-containing protein n=1 Tax=unclassified Bosea (in: a-proteobacteria) TaxID=2653178 RepID=UPI000F755830|nr:MULTISPECIES: SIMPL domain-containing protein [unclassified Bosea (in: a-proteobacteria)]AZO79558.1 hypothetical protein BLM15_19595 [Bosea sp. Tri-49]RXT16199.1 hypothetical protein B5U98_29805 [Bosea sp. Tri-39]RXT39892.1 hypothetical protein B5U99_06850 [Bosea sp. Tri-54]